MMKNSLLLALALCLCLTQNSVGQISMELSDLEIVDNAFLTGTATITAMGETTGLIRNSQFFDAGSAELFDLNGAVFASMSFDFASPGPSINGSQLRDIFLLTEDSDVTSAFYTNEICLNFVDQVPIGSPLSELNGTYRFSGRGTELTPDRVPNAGTYVFDRRIAGASPTGGQGPITVTVVPEPSLHWAALFALVGIFTLRRK